MKAKEAYMQTVMNDPRDEAKHFFNTNTNTMSELKVSGKIEKILPVESGTSKAGKEWKKQNFVINTGAEFNPTICFSVFGDEKVDNLTKYNKEGDEVEVHFNVSSREWEGKYFHNVDAWRIEKVGATVSDPSEGNATAGDLPF